MRLKLKEDPKEWRKAVLFSSLGMAILASLLCWRHVLPKPACVVALGALAALATTAAIMPTWFRGYYRTLSRISGFMGEWIGRLLLALVFLLLVIPLGIILRLAGKDLLRLKRPKEAQTHWREARECSPLDKPF